ncbi:MAG: Rrf2 family transcriptional regulator, partial [Clostridia bacterium]|nr:Rrf2 family transcriptional regulator [Clostridia bacterium]
MKISTKGRYAVRLMFDIAANSNGENVSLKDISKRQDISLKYLEQIVNTLSKAGLLKSQRGAQGGYKMTRKP